MTKPIPSYSPNQMDLLGWRLGMPVNHYFPTLFIEQHADTGAVDVVNVLGAIGFEREYAGADLFFDGRAYTQQIRIQIYAPENRMLFSLGLDRTSAKQLVNNLRSALEHFDAAPDSDVQAQYLKEAEDLLNPDKRRLVKEEEV